MLSSPQFLMRRKFEVGMESMSVSTRLVLFSRSFAGLGARTTKSAALSRRYSFMASTGAGASLPSFDFGAAASIALNEEPANPERVMFFS